MTFRLLSLPLALAVLTTTGAYAQAKAFVFGTFEDLSSQEVTTYINSGGDLDIRNHQNYSLLHWAAWAGAEEIAQSLLERGVSAELPSSLAGRTPLMVASLAGQPEMVAFLLRAGADPNIADEKNFTALHFWAGSGHPETLTHLLDAGADPLAKISNPGEWHDQALALDGVRKRNPWVLDTDPGRRLLRLTYEGTGCEGVIVLASDSPLSVLAERTLGKASRWKEIAKLNDLGADKSYRLGDCLKLPVR